MRKLLIGFFVLIALCVGAILILPSLIPSSVYKEKIEQTISANLGRAVHIKGDVKLSVFPTLSANAQNVTIANADGFSSVNFATMESLNAKVQFLPLLKKQVEIKEFTLINPIISFEKTKQGQTNWQFGSQEKARTVQKGPFKRDGGYSNFELSLGIFSLKNGEINFTDASTGKNHSLKSVNVKMSIPAMNKTMTAKGDLVFNGTPIKIDTRLETPLSFLNGKISPFYANVDSELITLTADGVFTQSQDMGFEVNFDANIPSVSKLDALIGNKNPYGALSESAKLNGHFSFDGQVLSAKTTNLALDSDLISTTFSGDFTVGVKPSASGMLSVNVKDLEGVQAALGMNIAQIQGVKTLDIKSNLSTNGAVTTAKNIVLNLQGDNLDAKYTGTAKFDSGLSLDGIFNANSPSITALLSDLGLDPIDITNALGDFKVSGGITGRVEALNINNLELKTQGPDLTASYSGTVSLDGEPQLNGRFDVQAPSLKTFASNAKLTLPYADALGSLNATGKVKGALDALTLTSIESAVRDGLLNVSFTGDAKTGEALTYNGLLNVETKSLRELAALGGTQLAVSTAQGEVYGLFSLSGNAEGTAKRVNFSNAKLRIDQIQGDGNFTAKLDTAKPFFGGTLNLNGLDLRPYMVAQNPTGQLQAWSTDPLNLAALKLFDADLVLNTPNILVGRIALGQSAIQSSVKNGLLTSKVPNVTLYGGKGNLDMKLDTHASVPTIALDFTLNDVDGKGFLGAAAGFTKLSGNTGTTMSFRGAGRSQAEIMSSLNGGGNFELAEGIIAGVDIGQFVGGLDSAFQQRSLPAGLGNQYTTPFKKLAGLFTVKNGVVTMGNFGLSAHNVSAEGSGTLDLGRQTLDFSLRPRLLEGKGMAGFGIPIRFSGSFGSVKASLDTQLLGKVIAARAKQELQKEITKKVGGQVGSILGGVFGGTTTGTQNQPKSNEDVVGGLLDGILGGQKQTTPSQDETTTAEAKPEDTKPKDVKKEPKKEPKKEEELVEDLLKGLFGKD